MTTTVRARERAIEVLRACIRKNGFFASGLSGGYDALWARDSMITALGSSLLGEEFKEVFKKSLETLKKNQTELGLIPNCVGSYNIERESDVTFNSIDAPEWYIIGQYVYSNAYSDDVFLKKNRASILRALTWLKHQDPNHDRLLVQQPTMDWMDAFPHKYGRVMHTQALYYAVLKMVGEEDSAEYIKKIINGETQKYLALYDKNLGYYRPWVWKDHDGDRESEEWFDSAANLLAIVTGLATPKIAKSILNHIEKNMIDRPYPCKAIWPPLKPGDKAWKSYFEKCDAREPFHYLNGGVWPFIGGFYVAALVKVRDFKKASRELERLAKGVLAEMPIRELEGAYDFNEWLDGKTGEPSGEPYQAWSAGMYLYAYECLKRKKIIYFS